VPADDVELGIDQHRNIEAEGLDAVRDLPDLLSTVNPRISGIRFEFFGRPKIDPQLRGGCSGLKGFVSVRFHRLALDCEE
jgi:hypothetical protein